MKKKMYLIEHNPQDNTSTDCNYRALVRDGRISIKGTHMLVSMIFLKANRMEVFGGNGYNDFLRDVDSGFLIDPPLLDETFWAASCATSLFDCRAIPGRTGIPLLVSHLEKAANYIKFQCLGASAHMTFPEYCNSIGVVRLGRDKGVYRCIPLTFNTFLEKIKTTLGNTSLVLKSISCECKDVTCDINCCCSRYCLPCTINCGRQGVGGHIDTEEEFQARLVNFMDPTYVLRPKKHVRKNATNLTTTTSTEPTTGEEETMETTIEGQDDGKQ